MILPKLLAHRVALALLLATAPLASATALDLAKASIVLYDTSPVGATAATVLVEEVQRRTGITLPVVKESPATSGSAIYLLSSAQVDATNPQTNFFAPEYLLPPESPGGYGVYSGSKNVTIVGFDGPGVLYGVGKLLRNLDWGPGALVLAKPLNLTTAPDDSIRGHQLGYRTTANSYDAWTPAQYDQYIRELALFGANAVENIPFQDDDSPLFHVSRAEMNRAMGESCRKYGVAYWVWTPATVDLKDPAARAGHLKEHEAFYQNTPNLDAIFVPGGDPGDNDPSDVLPFLEDLSKILAKYHPKAEIWMSLQGFNDAQVDYFFDWIGQHQPKWLAGAVGGPSSPPLPLMRKRLPKQYRLRDYPDVTHSVRAQYAAAWIDPAFAFTSGREGTNPSPVRYTTIFRAFAKDTDGFISYSDGMHDDVNKTVWSLLGWDVDGDVREGLIEYCRFFFGHSVAERAADGLYALEKNWDGPLALNGSVESTLALWQQLDRENPDLKDNWRWQLCLLKAHYDSYIRGRLIHEEKLEAEANDLLAIAAQIGIDQAMDGALAIFAKADTESPRQETRAAIFDLCERLNQSIGYQSSVEKYGANNAQRSAVLDFVDFPLNNRWWYEDQFKEIRALASNAEKLERLNVIATWENPGPGSFYDDIGNIAKSTHVLRGESLSTDPLMRRHMNPDFMWWDNGRSRLRQSWVSKMDWPIGLRYDDLDAEAEYVVRTTGLSQCLLRVNGERVQPTLDGKGIGEIKEFPVPKSLYPDGTIILTFDVPEEPGINWRNASRLTEVWLIKK